MAGLSTSVAWLPPALAQLLAALPVRWALLRTSPSQIPNVRRRSLPTMLWVVFGAALLLAGTAGCGAPTAAVITRVVTSIAPDTPTAQASLTIRTTETVPIKTPEGDVASSIEFVIPDDGWWKVTASHGYSISGDGDTFAWSKQAVGGDFEFSADVESDFANNGEAMVLVYGDGKGWTPGCLIFNITGYWQSIRANSVYDPEAEWVYLHEERLDVEGHNRFRMTLRVSGKEASLFVDDRLVASTPMYSRFNREGYLALVKWGGSAPVTFSNIEFSTGAGGAVAAAPTATRSASATPRNTPTPRPQPTHTRTPTPKPSPTPTAPPTATRPPPTPRPTSPPTDTPPPPFRPPTGLLEDYSAGGQGELLIKNGTDADALVVLTGLDDKAVKTAYIRNAESYNMTGIPDGSYRLYYSKGEAFNQATNRFTKNATYQRLDATIEFTSSATQYTTWEVTLYGVVGGNVGSEPVDPSQFP